MSKITFKEYIDLSKKQLIEAASAIPVMRKQYQMVRYQTLNLQINEETKPVNLRPSHVIVVDWLFEDANKPTPTTFRLLNEPEFGHSPLAITNDSAKLVKWLAKNTKEIPMF
jgi:hypothetical protein